MIFPLRGAITKKQMAKVRTLSQQGGGSRADGNFPTSLVGENAIAGRKKVITGRKKSLLGEKCIVLTKTQFIQKINKKIPPTNSPTNASQPHQTFVMAPLNDCLFGSHFNLIFVKCYTVKGNEVMRVNGFSAVLI